MNINSLTIGQLDELLTACRGRLTVMTKRGEYLAAVDFFDERGMDVGTQTWTGPCLLPLLGQISTRLEILAPRQLAHKSLPEISCSQCGQAFGQGMNGFSHCSSHAGMRPSS